PRGKPLGQRQPVHSYPRVAALRQQLDLLPQRTCGPSVTRPERGGLAAGNLGDCQRVKANGVYEPEREASVPICFNGPGELGASATGGPLLEGVPPVADAPGSPKQTTTRELLQHRQPQTTSLRLDAGLGPQRPALDLFLLPQVDLFQQS